jgi:hypothetical protein
MPWVSVTYFLKYGSLSKNPRANHFAMIALTGSRALATARGRAERKEKSTDSEIER